MTDYYGSMLHGALLSDVKSAWGLADDHLYLEPPRSPLGLPYAVIFLQDFAQEVADSDAVNSLMLQTYTFRVEGLFARAGAGNASAQHARAQSLMTGLSPQPVEGVSFDRYVSNIEFQQAEFDSEPAWLIIATIIYTVYEQQ